MVHTIHSIISHKAMTVIICLFNLKNKFDAFNMQSGYLINKSYRMTKFGFIQILNIINFAFSFISCKLAFHDICTYTSTYETHNIKTGQMMPKTNLSITRIAFYQKEHFICQEWEFSCRRNSFPISKFHLCTYKSIHVGDHIPPF